MKSFHIVFTRGLSFVLYECHVNNVENEVGAKTRFRANEREGRLDTIKEIAPPAKEANYVFLGKVK